MGKEGLTDYLLARIRCNHTPLHSCKIRDPDFFSGSHLRLFMHFFWPEEQKVSLCKSRLDGNSYQWTVCLILQVICLQLCLFLNGYHNYHVMASFHTILWLIAPDIPRNKVNGHVKLFDFYWIFHPMPSQRMLQVYITQNSRVQLSTNTKLRAMTRLLCDFSETFIKNCQRITRARWFNASLNFCAALNYTTVYLLTQKLRQHLKNNLIQSRHSYFNLTVNNTPYLVQIMA